MGMKKSDIEQYGEFKGTVSTKLEILFIEIKESKLSLDEVRKDIKDLQGWKAWSLGFGAAAGFMAGIFKDIFLKKL